MYGCSHTVCPYVHVFVGGASACAIIVMQAVLMLLFVGGASACTGIVIQAVFMFVFVE
jgi:hypothetical protein